MELFSPEWLLALSSIIVIDLVLAGDNALVIAMAARHLPDHMRGRVIMWGIGGAIVTRILFVMIVVELLRVPALSFIGGLLLMVIAVKLVNQSHGEAHQTVATNFWRAVMTIIMADTVMSLDNVLAIAGASRGSYDLVIFGLALTIPIIVWGSQWFGRLLERYSRFLYVGSFVLFWTAASMMRRDPIIIDDGWAFSWVTDVIASVLCVAALVLYKMKKGEWHRGS